LPSPPRVRWVARRPVPPAEAVPIDEAFGGWAKADAAHFAEGGSFDRLYTRK
jgi:ABC-type sulfate transport system substrate-binding protein